jgi:hypothetical protein
VSIPAGMGNLRASTECMSNIEMRGADRSHLSPSNNGEGYLDLGSLVCDLNAHFIETSFVSVARQSMKYAR